MAKRIGPGRSLHPTGETNVGADFTPDQIEFMLAMDRFRQQAGCDHPTYRQVLEVFKSLGYRKVVDSRGL